MNSHFRVCATFFLLLAFGFSMDSKLHAVQFALDQGSSAKGSSSQGSSSQGSAAKGSSIQGSSSQGSAAKGSSSKMGAMPQSDQPLSEEALAFRDLQVKLRNNQTRIDLLYRTLPIGFPEKRNAYKAEIARLTQANEQLKTEVFDKAKAAFRSSDTPSTLSANIIQKRLISMLRPRNPGDQFQPEEALELITIMKDKFPESPKLLEFEFLANYAIERFENAERAILQLAKVTGADLSGPTGELQNTMEKYQQELMVRRMESNTDDLPRVLLVTTEGDITIELFENHAPNTVANFIHLIRDQKFYDGKLFHLVKPGEYAMSGSPTGNGMGDAGYRIPCECDGDKIRSHFRGTLSMMAPNKDRGGSQFFITQQPNPHTYDGKYTAFGRVIEGMDVVMKLNTVDMTTRLASTKDVSKIVRAEVTRARSHAYMPEKVSISRPGMPGIESGSGSGSSNKDDDDIDSPGSFDLLLQGSGKK